MSEQQAQDLRDSNHWTFEDYTQRMTAKQWRQILLRGQDRLIFLGRVCRLKAKSLGVGVVEVYKEPLNETK